MKDWRHYLVVTLAWITVPLAGFVGVERMHDWLRRLTIRLYGIKQ